MAAKLKPWHWLLFGTSAFLLYRLYQKWELWDQLEMSLSRVNPGINRQGVYIDATFSLNNKTAADLNIDAIDGWLLYQGKRLAALTTSQTQAIPPGISNFQVEIKPTLAGTVDLVKKLIAQGSNFKQDFAFNGLVKLANMPAFPINTPLSW